MSELFDTTHVRDDPEYWDAMSTRVAAGIARAQTPSLLDWLASPRAAWLAASTVVAAFSIVVIWTPGPAAQVIWEWTPVVAPADSVGKRITVADRPPDIELLLDDRIRSVR